MLRPLLLAILLCFPGVPVMAFLPARITSSPVLYADAAAYYRLIGDVKATSVDAIPVNIPIVTNAVPDQSHSLAAGAFSINMSEVFSDTDGHTLSYSAISNKPSVATLSVEGNMVLIMPVAPGNCRIRLTARDNDNEKADDTFTLTIVENLPPALAPETRLESYSLFTGGPPLVLNLSHFFIDPDGDPLFFTAASVEENIAQVAVNQHLLSLTPNQEGKTVVSVSADDQHGGILLASFEVEVLPGYPSTLTSDVHVAFSDYRDQGNYRMVALPGDQSVLISNVVSGDPNKDWVAYAADTSGSGLLIPYQRSSDFVLKPGGGLWLLSKEDWVQPLKTISTVALNNRGAFELPLHSGWNVISNPLDIDIPWATVAQHNNVSQGLWRWDHGYNRIDTLYSTLNIQEAYYFNNTENLKTLALPYFFSGTPSKKATTSLPGSTPPLALEVESAFSGKKSGISIVWAPEAATGFDRLDQLAPPAHFSLIALSLKPVHPDFNAQPLAIESRPTTSLTHRFDLEVYVNEDEWVTFYLNRGELQSGESLFAEHILLVNRLDTKTYNLRDTPDQQIAVDAGVTPFSLYVGELETIQEELKTLTPGIFSLKQNFPNPFTPQTTIEYAIPTTQYVNLSVFDLMGRHIVTLHKGEKEAGLHLVRWNGRDKNQNLVANGVYFYRLQAGSWTQSQKMTLIR